MKINRKEFEKIKNLMPIARKPTKISNQQFLNALLYMIENGCKWRAMPKKFGNWHTIYMRFSRWAKNGTIRKIFEELQKKAKEDIRSKLLMEARIPLDNRALQSLKNRKLLRQDAVLEKLTLQERMLLEEEKKSIL